MDVPNRSNPWFGLARWIVLVWLIQAGLGAKLNAGTSLVLFNSTNVPAQATNIALVISGSYYGVVRNDGTAVIFGSFPTEIWNTNPPFLSLIILEDAAFALLANHIVYDYPYSKLSQLSNVVAICQGKSYNYALNANGTLYSFDYPTEDDTFHDDPIASTFSNIVAVAQSIGASENLALKNDGTIIQWNSGIPNPPAGLSKVVGITSGYGWALALRNDGTVIYWGNGEFVTNVPPGLSNVIAISTFFGTSAIALKGDGTLTAWGYNAPNVVGLTNVTAIGNGFAVVDTDFPHRVVATNFAFINNVFSLQVPSLSGKIYCLEYATNLLNPIWTPLPLVAGNGEMLTLTDTNAVESQRFYRVRKWQ